MHRIMMTLTAAALVCITSTSTWAAKRKRDFVIPRDCVVQGQEVKTGSYTVEYDDAEPGELVIRNGRQEVVRTSYTLIELPKPATADTVVFTSKDGVRKIARIEIKGSKMALKLES